MKKIMTRLLSLVLLGAFIPNFVLAKDWDLKDGSITVNATPDTAQTVTQGTGTPTEDTNPVITSSGTTDNTVTIEAGKNATANVTLDNVNIDVSSDSKAAITTKGDGNVTIELEGTNTVQSGSNHAGVEKDNTGTLTITDKDSDGSLTATGGANGAGIGGGNSASGSHITIKGGTVTANGGDAGAGIGGGSSGAGTGITISGGKVKANGGFGGAGIGGGYNGAGSDITIEKGKVTAQGGESGAGIGGGAVGGNGTDIKVFGGEVNATGGNSGAGIGGGLRGNGSNITVENGTVTANGGEAGAGIGGGAGGGAGTDIKVFGGTVTANGGDAGAGIGGGFEGDGTGIAVSGGEVNATGSKSGAGIGGGAKGTGTGITVSNDAQVKVQGGEKYNDYYGTGAGIGDGGNWKKQDGAELPQDPDKLNGGTIQYYAPGADMKTGVPTKILYNPNGNHNWDGGTVTTPATCTTPGVKTYTCQTQSAHTKTQEIPALGHLFETYVYNNDATTKADGTETAHCAHPGCTVTDTRTAKGTKLEASTNKSNEQTATQQSPYWVTGPEGQSLTYQAQQKDGVLTVTVQEDTASLHGTTESLRQLEAQGITEIRFVTNGAQSGFALSDLLASGTGTVTLTHEGDQVTFTLESKDISGILK